MKERWPYVDAAGDRLSMSMSSSKPPYAPADFAFASKDSKRPWPFFRPVELFHILSTHTLIVIASIINCIDREPVASRFSHFCPSCMSYVLIEF